MFSACRSFFHTPSITLCRSRKFRNFMISTRGYLCSTVGGLPIWCARSIITGLGNDGPNTSRSDSSKNFMASDPSAFSGRLTRCRLFLQWWFSRSSSLELSNSIWLSCDCTVFCTASTLSSAVLIVVQLLLAFLQNHEYPS